MEEQPQYLSGNRRHKLYCHRKAIQWVPRKIKSGGSWGLASRVTSCLGKIASNRKGLGRVLQRGTVREIQMRQEGGGSKAEKTRLKRKRQTGQGPVVRDGKDKHLTNTQAKHHTARLTPVGEERSGRERCGHARTLGAMRSTRQMTG